MPPADFEKGIAAANTPLFWGSEEGMAKRLHEKVQVGMDEYGKPQYKTISVTGNHLDLQKAIAEVLSSYGLIGQNIVVPSPSTRTFGDVLEEYNGLKRRKLKPKTAEDYSQQIKKHLADTLCKMPIAGIDTSTLQHFFNDLEDAGLSHESMLKIKNIISPAFKYAFSQLKIISINPMDMDFITIGGREAQRHKPFSNEKMKEIKSGLMTLPDDVRRMVALMAITGMRTGEMLGLKWEDIDLGRKDREIYIHQQVTHPKKQDPIVQSPKTKTSIRYVPITPALIEALEPWGNKGFIVSGDKPFTYPQFRRREDKFIKAFDLGKGYKLYNLRCTCLSELAERGLSIELAAQLAGHADPNTTRKYYLHIREKGMSDLATAMDASWQQAG